jgi:uncharacterized protein (DUF427 family)
MNIRMKTLGIAFALVLFAATGTLAAEDWEVGDHVMVNWTGDDFWYPGTVVAVENGEYFVVFDDFDREWVPAGRIRPENLSVGDKVFCNWMGGGIYYPGEIASRRGNAIIVHYEDGDVEATTIAGVRVQ